MAFTAHIGKSTTMAVYMTLAAITNYACTARPTLFINSAIQPGREEATLSMMLWIFSCQLLDGKG
jgi:hypothetical protein